MVQFHMLQLDFSLWRKPNVAMTYGYIDICKQPFHKISERTVITCTFYVTKSDPQKVRRNSLIIIDASSIC